MKILDFIKEKQEFDLDAPEATLQHREIVMQKSFLKKLYIEWYQTFISLLPQLPTGHIIEIGSGGGFLKDLAPQVITSDIIPLPHCDKTFAAEKMPFEDNSVSAIFMLDVLHHIPDSEGFLKEAERVLLKDGIIFMIEPATTTFSKFIYRNLHHEPFNPDAKEWKFPTTGPLSGANGALPWIIFKRDYEKFTFNFPGLELQKIKYHTPLRYLVTGGLSYKSLVPGWSFGFVSLLERVLTPIYSKIAMFQTIVVIKN